MLPQTLNHAVSHVTGFQALPNGTIQAGNITLSSSKQGPAFVQTVATLPDSFNVIHAAKDSSLSSGVELQPGFQFKSLDTSKGDWARGHSRVKARWDQGRIVEWQSVFDGLTALRVGTEEFVAKRNPLLPAIKTASEVTRSVVLCGGRLIESQEVLVFTGDDFKVWLTENNIDLYDDKASARFLLDSVLEVLEGLEARDLRVAKADIRLGNGENSTSLIMPIKGKFAADQRMSLEEIRLEDLLDSNDTFRVELHFANQDVGIHSVTFSRGFDFDGEPMAAVKIIHNFDQSDQQIPGLTPLLAGGWALIESRHTG